MNAFKGGTGYIGVRDLAGGIDAVIGGVVAELKPYFALWWWEWACKEGNNLKSRTMKV